VSETSADKARRLVTSGRVHVPDVERAVVDGDTGRHVIERHGETWSCDSAAYAYRGSCSHLAAVLKLTSPPPPQWRPNDQRKTR
jgi:hypothetical protein